MASSVAFLGLLCLGAGPVASFPLAAEQEAYRLEALFQGACSRRGADAASFRRPENHSFEGSLNVCDSDRLLPTVYILGAPKAATTSLAFDLGAGAGVRCAGGQKEWVFWNTGNLRTIARGKDSAREEVRQRWLAGLPACPVDGERQVAGDFSPQNLRQVSRPARRFVSFMQREGDVLRQDEGLPHALQYLYGSRVSTITFIVMVREPLSRIVSHWFYYNKLRTLDFQEGVLAMVNGQATDEQVWYGMYGHQMSVWLNQLPARQFYVIPYLAYGKGDTKRIARDLSERLKYEMVDVEGVAAAMNGAVSSHPPLENITTSLFRQKFNAFMKEDRSKLVSLLAQGHQEGMGLALYSGAVGNVSAVEYWLHRWW